MNKFTKNMCLAGMMAAIAYLLTAFASIQIYTGGGYLNFGDAIIMFASVVLGPWWGALVGAIAGSLADLTVGGFYFIPFTIVAKGGEAIIVGLLHKYFPKKIKWLSFILGAIWMIAVYFVSYVIMYGWGSIINSAFDAIQGTVGVILAIMLTQIFYRIFPKMKNPNDESTNT